MKSGMHTVGFVLVILLLGCVAGTKRLNLKCRDASTGDPIGGVRLTVIAKEYSKMGDPHVIARHEVMSDSEGLVHVDFSYGRNKSTTILFEHPKYEDAFLITTQRGEVLLPPSGELKEVQDVNEGASDVNDILRMDLTKTESPGPK